MWDLNDSPDHRRCEESEGCSSHKTSIDGDDEKAKRLGSLSNSSSSAVVIEDGSDEEDGGERGMRSGSRSKIFGVMLPREECSVEEGDPPPVTRQFFPVDHDTEMGPLSETEFPRAHWVGVKFCQSEPPGPPGVVGGGAGKMVEGSQPIKKSRRGPRSRSSQYRGVTFYRRTGRWESHIWFVVYYLFFFSFPHCLLSLRYCLC